MKAEPSALTNVFATLYRIAGESRTVVAVQSRPLVGDVVRIRESWRLPLQGSQGTVSEIDYRDPYGVYLVTFENGLHFRYQVDNIIPVSDRAMTLLFRSLLGSLRFSAE